MTIANYSENKPIEKMNKSSSVEEKPSRWKLVYDIMMLIATVMDLLLLGLDMLLMSNFTNEVTSWFGGVGWITVYQEEWHQLIRTFGGFFTIFLIVELCVRWLISIYQKRYYRWFFFPFAHWYEVLGCSPQLRILRLLRAGVIGYRLYQLGYQILPKNWIKTGIFYYEMLMEEISDRVILTAVDNIRNEIASTNGQLVQSVINKHRHEIEAVIVEVLHQEVTPLLNNNAQNTSIFIQPLAKQVGVAIQQSLMETPELRRIIRMIPIAGGMIESQLLSIGQHIGENFTITLSKNLTQQDTLMEVYKQIAKGIAHVDTSNPALEKLVGNIIMDSLLALENQVKVQQWKHREASPF